VVTLLVKPSAVRRGLSGMTTVFVPSAPTPAAGSIDDLTEARLKPLDVPVSAALACIVRLGVGSHEPFDRRPP
jgi:uncharacterized membrane protein